MAVATSFDTKRLMDIVVSSIALAVLSPLICLVAVAVRIGLGSPILFRQERPGLHSLTFTLVKFRTMRDGPGEDADRLTAIGGFLRSSSLDELPELWNVLKGEMSLVGPRPLLVQYLPLYDQRQATRHEVRPGITGLAQVNGRNSSSWEERLEQDAQYVESRSLYGDLQILKKTLTQVLMRADIAAEGEATMPYFAPDRPTSDNVGR